MTCERCDIQRSERGETDLIGKPCDICIGTRRDYLGRPCRHCVPSASDPVLDLDRIMLAIPPIPGLPQPDLTFPQLLNSDYLDGEPPEWWYTMTMDILGLIHHPTDPDLFKRLSQTREGQRTLDRIIVWAAQQHLIASDVEVEHPVQKPLILTMIQLSDRMNNLTIQLRETWQVHGPKVMAALKNFEKKHKYKHQMYVYARLASPHKFYRERYLLRPMPRDPLESHVWRTTSKRQCHTNRKVKP